MLEQRILDVYQLLSRSNTSAQFVKTSTLHEDEIAKLWRVFEEHHTITYEEFLARCREKCDMTALFRDALSGEIVGFMGVRHKDLTLKSGETISTLYFGHGFILQAYRGQQLIQRTVLALYLRCILKVPTRRVFIWSNALTVRPYLLTAKDLQEYYPHPVKAWPEDVREIRDRLGQHYYGDDFDSARGVVRKRSRYVNEHMLHIRPEKLHDPHVQLYLRLNPNYIRGDGLLTIQPATLKNLSFYMQLLLANHLTPRARSRR